MNAQPIIVENTFRAPAQKIWQALTNNDQIKQWYFQLEAFKPEVGFKFQFEGGDDKQAFLHLCRVTEVVPGKNSATPGNMKINRKKHSLHGSFLMKAKTQG